ncbi:PRC-barrel domain-containing protein [Modicisalibacter luteus]|uniref:PRC-barrel domain-containing protein n=1 Tax=Modicisalibacter luteus TaxID=453962 RepID=A0ABV7M249_9GAMM|nr:PRC-barrel domain-containing protein [Halomonas lutea]GHB09454.1 hypothetical protein GCM10007159_34520 [Halomonas lutea]
MKRTAIAIAVGALCTGLSGGVVAQQSEPEKKFVNADSNGDGHLTQEEISNLQGLDKDAFRQADANQNNELSLEEYLAVAGDKNAQQSQSGQQQSQSGQSQEKMDVDVQQKPADVKVNQEPPKVTVKQQPPEVTIEQPDPNVKIDQPKPDVSIDQAKPDVTVEQQGQPEVNVEQSGQAQVNVNEQNEQQQQQQQNQQQQNQNQQQQSQQQNSLMQMTASDLQGKQVVTQQGEELGEVGEISKSTQDNSLYAIVSVGGFLGLGEKEIALPLQEMNLEQDQLVMQTQRSKDQLKDSANEYNEQDYQPVEGNVTLSQAAGSGS